jgi:peroxiredoxin
MTGQARRSIPGILVLALFPLLGIVVAIATMTGFPHTLVQTQQTSASSANRLHMGQPAPDLTARTLDGRRMSLSDLQGSPVAISFWASWCEPCKAEMPELQSAAARYADTGLVVLAVNAGEPDSVVSAFVTNLKLTLPVLLDPDMTIMRRYGVVALPVTVWVDAKGVVRAEHLGALNKELIDRYVSGLIEKP